MSVAEMDEEGEQGVEEAVAEPGPGSEAPSPSRVDNGLDAIADADPQAQHAEEGSNTVLDASEQPDVISSYTGQEDTGQPADGVDEEAVDGDVEEAEEAEEAEPEPKESELEPLDEPEEAEGGEAGPGPGTDEPQQDAEAQADAGAQADGEAQADAEGQTDTAGQADDEGQADAQGQTDAEGQADAEAQADAGTQAEPDSAEPGAAQAEAGSQAEPDAEAGPQSERPASAAGEQPAASTSRPASGSAARPTSARPTSARPGSGAARPPSALSRRSSGAAAAAGSRPASASASNLLLTPDSVGLPAPPPAPTSGPGSRPGTSQSGARPGSRPGGTPPLPPAAEPEPEAAPARAGPAREAPASLPPTIPEDQPLTAPAVIDRYIAPGLKAIDVEVEQGPGLPHRLVRVLLDLTQSDPKPYLGGFRNKRTGAVYHHAGSQTPRAPKYSEADRKLSRETQTVRIKVHSQQTVREQATQMERPGLQLDGTYDRTVVPGPYQTADEREAIVVRATRCMQRWVRGWLGRRRAAYLRRKKAEREAFLREQEARAQREAEEHRRREIQRRMHPRTAGDFEVLYNELEAWRLQETRRIKEAGLGKEAEAGVLGQLLHKETKLLQTIDRLKINANQENKESRIQHTLNEMAKPKKFALRNGGKVDVHTPFTTRAKELQQLYNGLNLPLLTVDERLDVLLHVKWTVKEFDCDLTREVVELIDREADLLNRGRNPKVLEGLRKRISTLFLNFIETPEFNPEAARFQIVPMDFETYLYEQVGTSSAKSGVTIGTRPTTVGGAAV